MQGMRLALILLPLLGCQAGAAGKTHAPTHSAPITAQTRLTGPGPASETSEYRLMQLQVGISQADLLIDVLELCDLAMSEATSNEKPGMVRVCSRERLRRRSAEAPRTE